MEKSETKESTLRKFFDERFDKLNEEEQLNFISILNNYLMNEKNDPDYFIYWPRIKSDWDWMHPQPENASLPMFEGALTKKYSWPSSNPGMSSQLSSEYKLSASLEEINAKINALNAHFNSSLIEQKEVLFEINKKINEALFKATSLSTEIHEKLIPESFGIDPSDYPVSKFIPIKVYFSDHPENRIAEIITSIGEFIDSIGFLFVDEFPSTKGSWGKNWFGKSKKVLTSDEFQELIKKGERALELAKLDKVQSEVNKNNAEAACNLIGALEKTENAAIQIGSLLLVKVTNGSASSVHTRQLTNKEMILLEKNQSLLHQPTNIIQQLEKLSGGHTNQQ